MKQYRENHILHTWRTNNYFIITIITLTFTTDFDTCMIRTLPVHEHVYEYKQLINVNNIFYFFFFCVYGSMHRRSILQ